MKKGKMLKRPVALVPQTLEEAAEFVRRIGEARREIDRIEATLNQEVETLKNKAVNAAKPHEESIDRLKAASERPWNSSLVQLPGE